jgi:deazaflavin-dependent oxidoreductase (nitroreductase family)
MAYADIVNRLSTTRFGSWLTRQTAARIDPWIYRKTGGRLTMAGKPTIPQVMLTTTGRKSGKRREVQLAALSDGDEYIVVASNFGQEHHPAWMYNLQADPHAEVLAGARVIPVTAEALSADEKDEIWPRLHAIVPQFDVYLTRTDRDIEIFRLRPS